MESRAGRDSRPARRADMTSVTSQAKTRAIGVLTHHSGLRLRVRRLRTRLRRLLYRWSARGPVDPHLVVFESFVGRRYVGSPRELYEAMLEDPRFADYRFAWAFRDAGTASHFPALQDPRVSVVRFGSTDYYRAFGRAGTWITNSIVLPELVPRPGQLYVQTWHGTGIKRIGLDVVATTASTMNSKAEVDERYRIEAAKIDVFVVPAPFGTTVFASAFGLPADGAGSPFVEVGNPRNDPLVRATSADIAAARHRLDLPADAKVLLYAPTFRDDQYEAGTGYVFHPPLDLAAVAVALGPEWVILYRGHYLVSASSNSDEADSGDDAAKDERPVRDVSAVEDVNDLLLVSDVLVTDYSSLCFDFTLLDRPMMFYLPDVERYAADLRGFYFPVQDLPGPIVHTQDELIAGLLDPESLERDAPRRRAARQRMCPHDDGQASRRVLDLLLTRPSR